MFSYTYTYHVISVHKGLPSCIILPYNIFRVTEYIRFRDMHLDRRLAWKEHIKTNGNELSDTYWLLMRHSTLRLARIHGIYSRGVYTELTILRYSFSKQGVDNRKQCTVVHKKQKIKDCYKRPKCKKESCGTPLPVSEEISRGWLALAER